MKLRKDDFELNESQISKSFSQRDIPEDVKYLVKLMQPITKKHTDQTFEAAERVLTERKHIKNQLINHVVCFICAP